jgi:hypothetical protein
MHRPNRGTHHKASRTLAGSKPMHRLLLMGRIFREDRRLKRETLGEGGSVTHEVVMGGRTWLYTERGC